MAITIDKIKTLKEYFGGVMDRADHHADNVNEIVLALIGGVIWRAEDSFEVKQYGGEPANILWMCVGERRLCFKFNHDTCKIECREGGHNGSLVEEFENSTPISSIKEFFAAL